MKAVILAAGVGMRLGGGAERAPKSLLSFSDRSLLERHLHILRACGIDEIAIGLGYKAQDMRDAISGMTEGPLSGLSVHCVYNPDYEEGNVVTLWCMRDTLRSGADIVLMDADVPYDERLMLQLVNSSYDNCFLMDRNFDIGDEPVKVCLRDKAIVAFGKQLRDGLPYDVIGESVGFFRLSGTSAAKLSNVVDKYVDKGLRDAFYEDALWDLVSGEPRGFGVEDVTGLPWIEIDFPQDVLRAERDIVPQLVPLSAFTLPIDDG